MSASISLRPVSLDPSVFQLSDTESEFLKQQTGISDDQELRKHILQVQAEAWKVSFSWLNILLFVPNVVIISLDLTLQMHILFPIPKVHRVNSHQAGVY